MTTQQNEIDVLKAQVKTLKRMFYGFGCLVVAGIALAATSMQGPTSGNFTDVTCTSLTVNDGAIKINKAGNLTTKLYSDGGGDGQVKLYNSAGNMCAQMYGDKDGDGRLRIYNQSGGLDVDLFGSADGGILQLESTTTNNPAVQLDMSELAFMNTATNNPVVQLNMGELSFMNNEGDEIARLHNGTGSEAGGLFLWNNDGKTGVVLNVLPNGGVFSLYNQDGDPIYNQP